MKTTLLARSLSIATLLGLSTLVAPAAVPEPGSVALLVGMARVSGFALHRRKK